MTENYLQLEAIFKKITSIHSASSILNWDKAVIMPSGGAETRTEQMATLGLIAHELLTNPKNSDLLKAAEHEASQLSDWNLANLKEMRRIYDHATIIPEQLVEAVTKANSKCEMVWRSARAENDFKKLEPYLTENLNLTRKIAEIKSERFNCSKYDALLDEYDPGLTTAKIDKIFGKLEQFLPNFINQVIEHQASKPAPLAINGNFPVDMQKELGLEIMKLLGFDFNHGRLDVSNHPFCGGTYGDIRITTRYSEQDFLPSLTAIIHEAGHALYESNRPQQYIYQPVSRARGMGIHESQSLLMERQVGCSIEFLELIQPIIASKLKVSGPEYTAENFYKIINQVKRSLIRVEADEVTYPAHVILRYNLEKDMIEGKLEIKDLPEAWRSSMQALIGITPEDDKDGCMQDIHWPMGAFGYFPTYSFGAIHAAQIFAAAKRAIPNMAVEIKQGNIHPLNNWLKENIHKYGSKYSTSDLLTKATGSDTDVDCFINYLQNKFLS
jgi:carboxypeptidase Taq